MQIRNNTSAFNVWKRYTNNVSNLQGAMSKLSSGSRINNASNNPMDLALSERLQMQSHNTAVAAGNAGTQLNNLQIADSWVQKIHSMLGRMGELAVMANDDARSTADKVIFQKEFKQMQGEVAQIVGAVDGGQTFMGVAVDSTYSHSDTLSSGSHWGDQINSGLANVAAGLIAVSGTESDADGAASVMDECVDYISTKRADIGAEMKRMRQTLDELRSYEENMRATDSRICDVAKGTAEISEYNVLQQVETAMQVPASQLPQGVLQFLG